MVHKPNRRSIRGVVVSALLTLICARPAQAQTKDFDVPAQAATSGIPEFARQASIQILVSEPLVRGKQTSAVSGARTVAEALTILLRGTGLATSTKDGSTFTLALATTTRRPADGIQHFDIPAQDLASALDAFRVQSGLSVAAPPELSVSKKSAAVRGDMSPNDALRKLLKGSDLEFGYAEDGSVAIRRSAVRGQTADADKDPPEVRRTPWGTVVVTGQRIQQQFNPVVNVDVERTLDDVQPYTIFDSQTIEQSGAVDIEDFLKQRLTMNTIAQTNSQMIPGAGSAANNVSSINLRGLGIDHTLVLVNGRRVASVTIQGTDYQPDLNGIPLNAIDRIEILPSSASGIYGGSAIGGVVNVILKKTYSGGEIRASQDSPLDVNRPLRTYAGNWGKSLEGGKTQLMISGSDLLGDSRTS